MVSSDSASLLSSPKNIGNSGLFDPPISVAFWKGGEFVESVSVSDVDVSGDNSSVDVFVVLVVAVVVAVVVVVAVFAVVYSADISVYVYLLTGLTPL